MSESTLVRQVVSEIQGSVIVNVIFKKDGNEYFTLYNQDKKYLEWWGKSIAISDSEFDEIVSQFTDEQFYNTDPEVIRTDLSFKEFTNKYNLS